MKHIKKFNEAGIWKSEDDGKTWVDIDVDKEDELYDDDADISEDEFNDFVIDVEKLLEENDIVAATIKMQDFYRNTMKRENFNEKSKFNKKWLALLRKWHIAIKDRKDEIEHLISPENRQIRDESIKQRNKK